MKKTMIIILFSVLFLVTTSTAWVFADMQDVVHDLLSKGNQAILSGEFNNSINYFDQALKIEPNNTSALDSKGVALGNMREYNESITYFDQVLKIEPNNTDGLNNKAAALIKLGKYDEAQIYINQALKIQPGNLVTLSNKKVAINHGNISLRSEGTAAFEIFCQIAAHKPNGALIAYLEPPNLYVYDEALLNAVLDTQSPLNQTSGIGHLLVEKSNFTKNGKKFEETDMTVVSTYGGSPNSYTVASKTGILHGDKFLFWADHDGYQLLSGDTITQKWEIIRPVQ
jgi:tetratricopeptide (TPR) repeat protein